METHHYGTAVAQDPTTNINSAVHGMLTLGNPVAMYLNKRTVHKHVDQDFVEGPGMDKPVICLNYCTACSSQACPREMHEVFQLIGSEHFQGSGDELRHQLMDYMLKDMTNLSYQNVMPHRLNFAPMFDPETYSRLTFSELMDDVNFKTIAVSDLDKRPIVAAASECRKVHLKELMRKHQFAVNNGNGEASFLGTYRSELEFLADCLKKKVDQVVAADIPISWIPSRTVVNVAAENFPEFLKRLEWTPSAQKENKSMGYKFPPEDFWRNIVNVAGSQALHMSREGSIIAAKNMPLHDGPKVYTASEHSDGGAIEKDYLYVVPAFCPGAAFLSYALRTRCLPGCREDDVSSCPMRHNFQIFYEHQLNQDDSIKLDRWGAKGTGYKSPAMNNDAEVGFVCQLLFMALITRMNGNTLKLDLFEEWKKARDRCGNGRDHELGPWNLNVPLANLSSLKEFVHFLVDLLGGYNESMSSPVSKQFDGSIDEELYKSVSKFATMAKRLIPAFETKTTAKPSEQHGRVADCLRKMPKETEGRNRLSLITALVESVCAAADIQKHNSTYFMAAQALADVEGFLIDVAGPVSEDSIFFGHGSCEGIDTIWFNDELDRKKTTSRQRRKRLSCLYHLSVEHYKKCSLEERDVLGLFVDATDALRWTSTHRCFSLLDTEHFCCKNSIVATHTNPSRTISENPKAAAFYSHPRPVPKQWDFECAERGKKRWAAFLKLKESERRHSHHFELFRSQYCTSEELEEVQASSCKNQGEKGSKKILAEFDAGATAGGEGMREIVLDDPVGDDTEPTPPNALFDGADDERLENVVEWQQDSDN